MTMAEVREHFGTPNEFAKESMSVLDDDEIQRQIKKSKYIKRIVAILVAVLVLIFAITAVWIIAENSRTAVYYSEEIGEYE